MAGRPVTTARRITVLEEAMYQLAIDVHNARPKQYVDRAGKEGDDELALVWNEAVAAVKEAADKMGNLLVFIEDKAGFDSDERDLNRMLKRGNIKREDWELSGS
jgi:hypothetical protein